MRLALGGLLLFILLFLISVPLTGGMSIILIPVFRGLRFIFSELSLQSSSPRRSFRSVLAFRAG
jgi:hypothetical protein